MLLVTKLAAFTLTLFIVHLHYTNARPYKDSPIRTIIVPYQPNAIGYPFQYEKPIKQSRQVYVPKILDFIPNFYLDKRSMSLGSNKGAPVSFADGAYPVYYMPSNANGRFNGRIRLLK